MAQQKKPASSTKLAIAGIIIVGGLVVFGWGIMNYLGGGSPPTVDDATAKKDAELREKMKQDAPEAPSEPPPKTRGPAKIGG
jgi:hypothetical protein